MHAAQYTQHLRFYKLQPGDGTRYTIGLGELTPDSSGPVIPGVGDGTDYTMLAIVMPGGSGITVLNNYNLRNPHSYDIGYAKSHGLDACNTYTVAAALLAASVLIDDPNNIDGAHAAMLKAPELLQD